MTGNHFRNAPEALLGRNDSKNPATTCRGITSAGRPCRRALALSKTAQEQTLDSGYGGVITLIRQNSNIADAQYYCWQHKEQAETVAANIGKEDASAGVKPLRRQTEILELKNRSSIDTLIQRLGVQDLKEVQCNSKAVQSHRREPGKKSASGPGFWQSLCCMVAMDKDDTIEIVRHRKRTQHTTTAADPEAYSSRNRDRTPSLVTPSKLPLSLIPPDTSPQIAATIRAELNKPLNMYDEDGYIYIFWLTPSDRQAPGEGTARNLLPTDTTRSHARRISDVMTEYSFSETGRKQTHDKKHILLKIGRASNVTRRMNEWQRQCGHQLNLVRWYPYSPSTKAPPPLHSPLKTPVQQPLYPSLTQHDRRPTTPLVKSIGKVSNVKRVERLVHLELTEQQVKRDCKTCGREHREWFQIEASEAGIRKVDATIRRWVKWSEQQGHA